MKKRSIKIAGHATSITMEEPFWDALKAVARERETSLSALITEIDKNRKSSNLSSALRLFVLESLQKNADALSRNS